MNPVGLSLEPTFAVSGGGIGLSPLKIPADTSLIGVSVFYQAGILDGGAVGGVAMTNGLQIDL